MPNSRGPLQAADSVELASISFAIITSMECDLDLNDGRKGWIISATFIGMMVGGVRQLRHHFGPTSTFFIKTPPVPAHFAALYRASRRVTRPN